MPPQIDPELCQKCGTCDDSCPLDVIHFHPEDGTRGNPLPRRVLALRFVSPGLPGQRHHDRLSTDHGQCVSRFIRLRTAAGISAEKNIEREPLDVEPRASPQGCTIGLFFHVVPSSYSPFNRSFNFSISG